MSSRKKWEGDAFEISLSEAKFYLESFFDSHTKSTDTHWLPSKEYLAQDKVSIANVLKDYLSVLKGRKKAMDLQML